MNYSFNLNLLMIFVLLVLLCSIVDGYKKGMVKSIISFVSMIITCVVVALIANAIKNYMDGKIFGVIVAVILLCLIGLVQHLLGVVFFSAKAISKLPVVHWGDKMLGIVFGIMKTILTVWTIDTLIMFMNLGVIGQQIVDYTSESLILTWLYENNYLAYLVEQLGQQISFL